MALIGDMELLQANESFPFREGDTVRFNPQALGDWLNLTDSRVRNWARARREFTVRGYVAGRPNEILVQRVKRAGQKDRTLHIVLAKWLEAAE